MTGVYVAVLAVAAFHGQAALSHAVADVTMTTATPIQIRISSSDTIPPRLSVLGRDERLAFYDKAVVGWIALTPASDAQRRGPLRIALPLSVAPVSWDHYRIAYRGPGDDAWHGTDGTGTYDAALHALRFSIADWPVSLHAADDYNFVIYHTTSGVASNAAAAVVG